MIEMTDVPGERADVLLYVQHLLGIGHLRRAAVLSEAMTRAGLRVVFVMGGRPAPEVTVVADEVVQLPPARVVDESFSLVDDAGRPVSAAWKSARCEALIAVYRRCRPRCLLIELFPFGRRQMRFEILPLLEAARRDTPRPWILTSQRDVLNRPTKAEKIRWILDSFEKHFDFAIVHGDPRFISLDQSFPEVARIREHIRYSGYVVQPTPGDGSTAAPTGSSDEVLVSIGGGAVGEPLIAAAMAARPLSQLDEAPWRFLLGHNLPEDRFQAFATAAAGNVIVERARQDFTQRLATCRLSISQAGYNTVMELLSLGTPAVVVPFAAGSETEQSLRARLLATRGLLTVVEESGLTPKRLAEAIDAALEKHKTASPVLSNLDLDGAGQTAAILQELIAKGPP